MSGATVGEVLRSAAAVFASANNAVSDSPQLEAFLLLAHVLGVDRAALIAHPERLLTADQQAAFDDLVSRRAAGTPLPYLTGTRAFFRHDFLVSPDVLIPRPETEHLVERAIAWAEAQPQPPVIVDVGTGSGAIAVSLAAALPACKVHAADISPAALDVARRNAERVGVTNLRFHRGDLLDALPPGVRPALIAANLPYIAADEVNALPLAQHEPRLALDGGADGLDLIRRLLTQLPGRVESPCCLLLEIGAGQGPAVSALCSASFPAAAVRVMPDYAGHDRVVEVIVS